MLTKRHTRQRAVVAILTLVAVLFGAGMVRIELLDTTLQSIVYDRAITLSPAEVRNQITIVAIDDPTIKQYGPWHTYAKLNEARAVYPDDLSLRGYIEIIRTAIVRDLLSHPKGLQAVPRLSADTAMRPRPTSRACSSQPRRCRLAPSPSGART